MSDHIEPWMQTYTGKAFYWLNPTPESICIEDIAHHLSLINRFTGATMEGGYSVAQHSVHVSYLVPAEDALYGLLHDASEAFCADISRPLKALLPEYRRIERIVMEAVCQKFGLPMECPESVHKADIMAVATERRDLMGPSPMPWGEEIESAECHPYPINPYSAPAAEALFLRRFASLSRRCVGV